MKNLGCELIDNPALKDIKATTGLSDLTKVNFPDQLKPKNDQVHIKRNEKMETMSS